MLSTYSAMKFQIWKKTYAKLIRSCFILTMLYVVGRLQEALKDLIIPIGSGHLKAEYNSKKKRMGQYTVL